MPRDTATSSDTSPTATWRRPLLLVGALLAVLAAAAVLFTALTPATSAPASGPAGVPVAFTAATMSGQQLSVPGGKPSVLLFLGVNCGGCGPTATALGQLKQQAPAAANFVGVDITPGETDSDLRGFLTTNHATGLGYAFDTDARLIKALGVSQLTTVVVLDSSGAPTWRAVEPTPAQVQAELAKLAAR